MTTSASQLDRGLVHVTARAGTRFSGRAMLYGLLVLAALPDAMVPPMLRELFVVRYGVSESAAHWFMAVNLLGAACAVPLLGRWRRHSSPTTILAVAAAVNGLLLALLAFPIGFAGSLALRVGEGAVDLVVFAVLFDLIVRAGDGRSRGKRLGFASALLMFSIGIGLALGGVIGSRQPILVFIIGAVACLTIAVITCNNNGELNALARVSRSLNKTARRLTVVRHLWPTMGMALADRAVAGLFTATIPLFFVTELGLTTAQAGAMLAVTMGVMALGSWPAGVIGDRVGHLRVRLVAATGYAASVLCVAMSPQMSLPMLTAVMALVGLSGAALMPTSMALAARTDQGAVAMGSLHASGNVGFFIGIVGAGLLLAALEFTDAERSGFAIVITALVALHLLITAITTVALVARERRAHTAH